MLTRRRYASMAALLVAVVAAVVVGGAGTSAVAWALSRPVPVYRSPRDRRPERRLPTRDQFGITQVLLVKRAIPGWLEVYLPVRPNNSTGWVPAGSVGVTLNPYQVVVD